MNPLLVNVSIKRSEDNHSFFQSYSMEVEEKRTVLGILLEIHSQQDPTLAFHFGCRFMHCGLCAVMINGRAYPSCLYEVKGDLVLEPLKGFPVLQDLVVDRRHYTERMKKLQDPSTLLAPGQQKGSEGLYRKLLGCTECYCCLSECPRFVAESSFPGPLFYVKLAQAHLNPGGLLPVPAIPKKDLLACLDCLQCVCPYNIPIARTIRYLGHFLGAEKEDL